MPVLSGTEVIVGALSDTYDEVHGAFADQAGTTVGGDGAAVRIEE
jgi:hypothetical protein